MNGMQILVEGFQLTQISNYLFFLILFFKYILLIMLLQLSFFFFFSSLYSHLPCNPLPPTSYYPLSSCPWVGHTYKFFGFSISYTILNFPLSILCLPIMLLIPCNFSPIPSSPTPLITLHEISSSVILFLFQLFAYFVFLFVFQVQLLIVKSLLSFYCSQFSSSFSKVSPFNISYNKGLVMVNSFNLTLPGKHFICPSILNDNFAGQSNLGCRSLPFLTWNTSFQPLLACKVSFEKSADSLMGTPLQITFFFLFFFLFLLLLRFSLYLRTGERNQGKWGQL